MVEEKEGTWLGLGEEELSAQLGMREREKKDFLTFLSSSRQYHAPTWPEQQYQESTRCRVAESVHLPMGDEIC